MTVALVPLGFTLNYVLHSKTCDVERASQALLFSICVLVAEFFLPVHTRVVISVPLVLFVFFTVYQRLRSPKQTLGKPKPVQAQKSSQHRFVHPRDRRIPHQK